MGRPRKIKSEPDEAKPVAPKRKVKPVAKRRRPRVEESHDVQRWGQYPGPWFWLRFQGRGRQRQDEQGRIMGIERKEYKMLPTMEAFHRSDAIVRCIVGPVGSGKTTAAAHEICLLLPAYIAKTYGVTQTRWCIVRNSYRELQDTTLPSVMDWYYLVRGMRRT